MIVGSRKMEFLKYTPRVATWHKVHPNAPFTFGQNCPRKIAVSISRSTPLVLYRHPRSVRWAGTITWWAIRGSGQLHVSNWSYWFYLMSFDISLIFHPIMLQEQVQHRDALARFRCDSFFLQKLSYLFLLPHAEGSFFLVSACFARQGICILSRKETTNLREKGREDYLCQ